MEKLPDYLTEDLIKELGRRGVSCTPESAGSVERLVSRQTNLAENAMERARGMAELENNILALKELRCARDEITKAIENI